MPDTLSKIGLEHVTELAVKAVRKKQSDFFNQPGIKINLPWLTENLAKKEDRAQTRGVVDFGIIFSGALVGLGNMYLSAETLRSAAHDNLDKFLVLGGVSMAVSIVGVLRNMTVPEPINRVYEKLHGGRTQLTKIWETQMKERTDAEKQQVELLLRG